MVWSFMMKTNRKPPVIQIITPPGVVRSMVNVILEQVIKDFPGGIDLQKELPSEGNSVRENTVVLLPQQDWQELSPKADLSITVAVDPNIAMLIGNNEDDAEGTLSNCQYLVRESYQADLSILLGLNFPYLVSNKKTAARLFRDLRNISLVDFQDIINECGTGSIGKKKYGKISKQRVRKKLLEAWTNPEDYSIQESLYVIPVLRSILNAMLEAALDPDWQKQHLSQ